MAFLSVRLPFNPVLHLLSGSTNAVTAVSCWEPNLIWHATIPAQSEIKAHHEWEWAMWLRRWRKSEKPKPKPKHGHPAVQWPRPKQDIMAGHAARLFVFRVRFLPYFQCSPFTNTHTNTHTSSHSHIHRCRRPGSRKYFFSLFQPLTKFKLETKVYKSEGYLTILIRTRKCNCCWFSSL